MHDVHLIEAVQRRVAKFIVYCYSRYQSFTSILQELDWHIMQKKRPNEASNDVQNQSRIQHN